MNSIQEKVDILIKKYNLESSVEIRFIDLISEIGDTFFSLICVANGLNIDLKNALDNVLNKYENRFSNNGNIGSGR